ncbi:MAG TPA: type IV pilus modification protein PilV [Spongiibacteraceae bacterium]|jgi:type IV pilus assembly protein PilV|nr:type IV pilus modification protein PilV [Spongiibacteraceae bacterium]HUH36654.1 type IV pilus modification protein PilV [Spongiibacteraceae bacterium]
MMNSRPNPNPRPVLQRGASLIEVMVALFVLAIGLLGFAGLQTEGVMIGRKAYVQSQAIFLAEDIVERMRANRGALTNYVLVFGESPTASADCGPAGTSCSANELAAWDVQEWETLVANSVPAGDGEVEVTSVGGVNLVVVRVQYQLTAGRTNQGATAPTANERTFTYVLETQL